MYQGPGGAWLEGRKRLWRANVHTPRSEDNDNAALLVR